MSGRPYNYPSGEAPLRRYVFVSKRVVKTFSVNAYTEAQARERAEVNKPEWFIQFDYVLKFAPRE